MPVDIECWRAGIGVFNGINFIEKQIHNKTSHQIPFLLISSIREWIQFICSPVLLFIQILFFLSFIIIFSGPFLITTWLPPFDDYTCTPYPVFTGSVYIPFVILTRFSKYADVISLTINLIRCLFMLLVIDYMLLMLAGDIESNPGPKISGKLSFAVWNLNSLLARDG